MSENRDEDGRLREEVFKCRETNVVFKNVACTGERLNSHKFLFKYTYIYIYTAMATR